MKNSILLLAYFAISLAGFATPAEDLYYNLERRLHALKSLEVRYEAEDTVVEGQVMAGRLVWEKPDRFLHETPEWALCEVDNNRWRFLKAQNTLILEDVRDDQSEWLPEDVLFNLRKNFRARDLKESENGGRELRLEPADVSIGGEAALEFEPGATRPSVIRFTSPDGLQLNYRIVIWRENVEIDSEIFGPPDVPAENRIDFRGAGKSETDD